MGDQLPLIGGTRGDGSEDRDSYYTPYKLARTLCSLLPPGRVDWFLDPHAGSGAWLRAIDAYVGLSRGVIIEGFDIDPNAQAVLLGDAAVQDFLKWERRNRDLRLCILGNPPFSEGEAHVRHALEVADQVGFILRQGFLSSAERTQFWEDHPPSGIWPIAQRPKAWKKAAYDYNFYWWDQTKPAAWPCPTYKPVIWR